jgi:hypothetical protein
MSERRFGNEDRIWESVQGIVSICTEGNESHWKSVARELKFEVDMSMM